jgi:hypothetical protein
MVKKQIEASRWIGRSAGRCDANHYAALPLNLTSSKGLLDPPDAAAVVADRRTIFTFIRLPFRLGW